MSNMQVGARKDYAPFGWYNLQSPLVPYVEIRFRGAEQYPLTFPDKAHKIYIQNANFDVLNESGWSTASITLADPNFTNLEKIFLKALLYANSFNKDKNYWYCACIWGWSFYGKDMHNPGDTHVAQQKKSGLHYYMLKDLRYEMDEVELRVTFDLVDIGANTFGSGDEKGYKRTVGILSNMAGATQKNDSSGSTSGTDDDDLMGIGNDEVVSGLRTDGNKIMRELGLDKTNESPTATNSSSTTDPALNITNVITGKSYWQIIQGICAQQKPAISAKTLCKDEEVPQDKPTEAVNIPATQGLKEAIDDLLKKIAPIPSQQNPDNPVPTKHWGILAGGNVNNDSGEIEMYFGWIPDPPKRGDSLTLDNYYRLARTFTYRPGTKEEIASGETMITRLSYDWTSKGYWGVGIPTIYALVQDANGRLQIVYTENDWKAIKNTTHTLVAADPSIKAMSLAEAVDKTKGIKLDFNFDTRNDTTDKISIKGQSIIINVWNYFLSELIDVDIEIPGDPFLDNRIFSFQATNSDSKDNLEDLLVNLYDSYFIIKVYRPNDDGVMEPSRIFEGKYLCLKGCSHRISEGEYTTSLKLFKAF